MNYYEQKELWNKELSLQEKEKLRIVKELIPEDVKSVLDAGCGSGALSNFLAGYDIAGIDISNEALRFFKHKKIRAKIAYLPFKDSSFDLVICSDVLEHIVEDEFWLSIKELKRVARKYILIISPNDEDIEANQTRCWNCGTVFHVNWHIRSLNLEKLINLFKEEFSPVFYTYFGDIWASEPALKYKIKRVFDDGFLYWENAVCPLCGARQRKKIKENKEVKEFLEKRLNKYLQGFFLKKTEIAILFLKTEEKIKLFKKIDLPPSQALILSKNKKIELLATNKASVYFGNKAFCKSNIIPYPAYAYLLKNEKSLWSEVKENYRTFKERALVIFPQVSDKNLYIRVKAEKEAKLKINAYDVEKKFVSIADIRIRPLEELICVSIPELLFPKEGIIIELLSDKGESLKFYEMCICERPEFFRKTFTASETITLFNKQWNVHKKGIFDKEVFIFSEKLCFYNHKFRCFEIGEVFVKENGFITDIQEVIKDVIKHTEIAQIKEELVEEIRKKEVLTNNRIALIEEGLNKVEDRINQAQKEAKEIKKQLYTLNNNVEKAFFWIRNPHRYLYKKIKERFFKKSNIFHVVILTPDVQIDRRIIQMCKGIVKAYKARCTIIAALKGDDGAEKNIKIKRVKPEKVNVDFWFPEKIDMNLKDFYWLHEQYLKMALEEDADLYMVCDLPVLPAGVIASKMKNIPLIYDAHELYPEQAVFSKEKREQLSKIEAFFIRYADTVITVNEAIAEEMTKRYSINKPHVILNALNPPENFDVSKKYNHFRKNLPITENQKIVLFQGGFSPYRNLENLVKSGKYISEDIVIILMGFGDYEEELKKLAKSEGLLNKKVFFHPAVPQKVLLEYSASADVGIIPYPHVDLNSYYCTPNKLFEFIQAALPILANDSPELKRFVEGYNIGIVYKLEDEKSMAKGINKIFSNNLNVFKKNLLEIRKKICWQKEKEKFLNIVEKYVKR